MRSEMGLKPCQATTSRSSPVQAQVGEQQLRTVEYLIESGKS